MDKFVCTPDDLSLTLTAEEAGQGLRVGCGTARDLVRCGGKAS